MKKPRPDGGVLGFKTMTKPVYRAQESLSPGRGLFLELAAHGFVIMYK